MEAIVTNGWLFERKENGWVRIRTEFSEYCFGPKEWERIQKALGPGPREQTVLAPT